MQREDIIVTDTVTVSTISLAPGEQSPWHYHNHVQESVFCLHGSIVASCQDRDDAQLSNGKRIDFAPGQKHALHNCTAEPATYLLVQHGRYDFVECAAAE